MKNQEMIQEALARGRNALSELQSKALLKSHGVPVTEEALARNPEEAVEIARRIGYPVVLKACAWELMHKSEKGWVKLNLQNDTAVRDAFSKISAETDMALEGILVQEMVQGQRELVAGLSRDASFGPCVMLGLGGIMTEIIRDTVFRMAPIDEAEARDMAAQLKSKEILEAFRGQAPADMEAICRTLVTISDIGLAYDRVAEIDINPLIITHDGRVIAVDALVVLERGDHAQLD
jgi:acetate---CoA ligase (ADP-forming) subunit beta